MKVYPYTCGIDAEPLHRYCPGGYHPVHLGDVLGSGRYQITHKLGWGGYSTVWAAKEQRLDEEGVNHLEDSTESSQIESECRY